MLSDFESCARACCAPTRTQNRGSLQTAFVEFLHQILGPDLQAAGLIILNLILIESLLSIDNAAVLATMVRDLPAEQRARALRYGIWGAYVFRGACLMLAGYIMSVWWLKPLGGAYLLYLTFHYYRRRGTLVEHEKKTVHKKENLLYKMTIGRLGNFWATIAAVELMDLAFSLDNVLAAVAFTQNIPYPQSLYIVCIGVFIGMLAMRFVAQFFVKLMERFPFLETAAFVVIGLLGLKLVLSLVAHYLPHTGFGEFLDSEQADLMVSALTILIFGLPMLGSWLFDLPKRKKG